jgi:hypothetical protein
MTAIALLLFMAAAAGANDSWLEVRTEPSCSAAHLAERITERIVGERNTGLRVDVELRSEAGATVAAVNISRGTETLGEKTLLAPTCEEALAAVAAVVALAVSQPRVLLPRATEHVEDSAQPAPARRQVRPSLQPALKTAPSLGTSFERDLPAPAPEQRQLEVRLVGAAGVDVGTVADPAPMLGVGARAGAAWGELRGFAWYGLPTTREEVSVVTERTRADFLALSLDYCRGLDEARWLGLCGGLETSMRRTSRLQQAENQPAFEKESLEPTFGPLLSAAFAYRAARWVPELDVSMRLPLLEPSGNSRLGFRAAIGAALPF